MYVCVYMCNICNEVMLRVSCMEEPALVCLKPVLWSLAGQFKFIFG